MEETYKFKLTLYGGGWREESLACSGVAEAMQRARRFMEEDDTVVDVVVSRGVATIGAVSRRFDAGGD